MDINSLVGLEYDIEADKDPINNKVNCNGLIYMISPVYKEFVDNVYKNSKSDLFRRLDKKIQSKYEKVSFESREKDCIIFIRQKGTKVWNHIGYLVLKDSVMHADADSGVVIESISKFIFMNKEFLVFKEKEV